MRDITLRGFTIEMVPGVRIEVTAIRIAVAITTGGGIGIATLEAAWQHTVEQPVLCGPWGGLHFRASAEPNVTTESARNF